MAMLRRFLKKAALPVLSVRQIQLSLLVIGYVVSQLAAGLATAKNPVRETEQPAADAKKAADTKESELGQDWVRVERKKDGDVASMQTAIVRYASADA